MTSAAERLPTGYDAARTAAATRVRAPRGWLRLEGRDVVSFLHGVLTNDVRALGPGQGCYAAWLTPQGRMITDAQVCVTADGAWLEVPAALAAGLAQRIDQSIFTEDVRVHDHTGSLDVVEVHGPAAARIAATVLGREPETLARLAPGAHETFETPDGSLRVIATDRLGLAGLDLVVPAPRGETWRGRLQSAGAAVLSPEAAEALRIEAGVPVFGADMTADTIPLEAGIEGRAISMTKGCYVGQEIIVRILHRGHGRVARHLVGLKVDGADVPLAGAPLLVEGKVAGHVTSAAWSPRLRAPLALGYLHRDAGEAPEPRVGADTGPRAVVIMLPLRD